MMCSLAANRDGHIKPHLSEPQWKHSLHAHHIETHHALGEMLSGTGLCKGVPRVATICFLKLWK